MNESRTGSGHEDRPLAAVTGASSGIGLELAKQFAEHGFDLVVNAEDDDIQQVADTLRRDGTDVRVVQADLRDPAAVEELHAAIRAVGRPLAAIALNAGVGQGGAFVVDTELKYTDVTLTSLMPGPTDTEFFDRADMLDTKVGQAKKDDPAQVARQGFDSLMAGESRVVGGGLKTKVQEAAGKVMPDKAKAAMHRGMAEPGTGE